MSAAQMARFLKSVGQGSEYAGILGVYRAGMLVGAGRTLVLISAGYAGYRLGRWGYAKLAEYLQNCGYTPSDGEVV